MKGLILILMLGAVSANAEELRCSKKDPWIYGAFNWVEVHSDDTGRAVLEFGSGDEERLMFVKYQVYGMLKDQVFRSSEDEAAITSFTKDVRRDSWDLEVTSREGQKLSRIRGFTCL